MKQWVMAATFLCGCFATFPSTVSAQDANGQFSVATLNVDGLPQKILVVKVNPDGPGGGGSVRIGRYLQKRGYDLVMMQEDFNYHDVLTVLLEDDYQFDEWSGDVGLDGHKIDFLHLQNHRFDCDGLMACWKNGLQVTSAVRTAWKESFGKFSHANDEMVTKGFRRYDVTLRDGTDIVVYNMHMDASMDEDEAEQNEANDRLARMAQWEQLKADVLEHLDTRPIIITGDMNSLYGRDEVKQTFVDAINETGRGTVADVWVELKQKGVYPEWKNTPLGQSSLAEGSWPEKGETLDKILYINPTIGAAIAPVAYTLDTEGFLYNDQPLGDHYPVAATFKVVKGRITGIESVQATQPTVQSYYNLNGQRVSQPRSGVYINNGKKTVVR